MASAGIASNLEPLGLDARNGRRPDGATLYPFSDGKFLSWDSTCSDTFSASHINDCAHTSGSAANKAEARKNSHYSNIQSHYRFEPVSVETTGVYGNQTDKFIRELGRKISATSGDKRETGWLRQRISIAITRGNAASVLATSKAASVDNWRL